jgi:hypothetical protein
MDDRIGREIGRRRAIPERVQKAVEYAEAVEQGRGIVRITHIHVQERVTEEALLALDNLTRLESDCSQHTPDKQARFSYLVDLSLGVFGEAVADDGGR